MQSQKQFFLRPAREQDAPQLSVLATAVWIHTYETEGVSMATAEYLLREFAPEQFLRAIQDTCQYLLVAEQSGALQGFALLNYDSACPVAEGPRCELDRLYIQKHCSRKGIGAAMLRACSDAAKKVDPRGFWLSVYSGNPDALAFYFSQGMQEIGKIFFELGGEKHENLVLCMPR